MKNQEFNAYEHELETQQKSFTLRRALVICLSMACSLLLFRACLPNLVVSLDDLSQSLDRFRTSQDLEVVLKKVKLLRDQTMRMRASVLDILDQRKDENPVESGKFHMMEFEEYFRVKPLEKMEVHEEIAPLFANYNITKDPQYIQRQSFYDVASREYGEFTKRSPLIDERMYVKWNDEAKQYRLYAAVPMSRKSVLGVYTGELRVPNENTNPHYSWRYPANVLDGEGEALPLVVDCRLKGGWFRFIGRDPENGNVEAFTVPHENQWYLMYQTTRAIEVGEELTVL